MKASDGARSAATSPALMAEGLASALHLGFLHLAAAADRRLRLAPAASSVPLFAPEFALTLALLAIREAPRLWYGVALLLAEFALALAASAPEIPAAFALALLRVLVPPTPALALGRLGIELPANASVRGYLAFVAIAGLVHRTAHGGRRQPRG